MAKNIFKRKKIYLGLIIFFAASGTIFFFPMNIGGQYTCFYHRLFDPPQSNADSDVLVNNQNVIPNHELCAEASHHDTILLDNYLHQYAFIWWGSVGVLALCFYIFFKLRRNLKVNDSSPTLK